MLVSSRQEDVASGTGHHHAEQEGQETDGQPRDDIELSDDHRANNSQHNPDHLEQAETEAGAQGLAPALANDGHGALHGLHRCHVFVRQHRHDEVGADRPGETHQADGDPAK